jgi:endonuclease YncB( thermonuclease family)
VRKLTGFARPVQYDRGMHTTVLRTLAAAVLLSAGLAAGGQSKAPRVAAANPPRAGDEGVFYGPLVRVQDGDSLIAKIQGVKLEIRLAEIDAPERDQPFGDDAKRMLASLAAGKQLVIVPLDTDRYGRTVAQVWNGTTHLNAELVKRGGAWFDSRYARSATLYEVEQEARSAKRGLWTLPLKNRVEPWVWRERARGKPRN